MESNSISSKRLQTILNHLSTENSFSSIQLSISTCSSSNITEGPLDHERRKASFDPRELTYVLDGGRRITEVKEMVASVIQSDPELCNLNENRYDMTRPELRKKTMAKVKKVIELWNTDPTSNSKREVPRSGKKAKSNDPKKAFSDAFWWFMSLYDRSWATRVGVHFGLFMNAIVGQGTEEQQDKYLDDIFNLRIIGCFAMTELGHGSYIRGFETTATYDRPTQEFVINSPTDTSTKFWIGMAGQTATHTVAYARLILDNKDLGVHAFIVPLRDRNTGEALPGISIGDCGAKMGRDGLDNGWIQFHNVRVPLENMLMKWAKLSPEGVYTSPPKAQLSYGSLVSARVGIIRDSSDFGKIALTIAIRYSAIRRQFLDSSGQKEEQILNYQTHQYRLMTLLANCYAYHFTSNEMNKFLERVTDDLENKDLSNLPGLHATSAGLKAFSTWWCNDAIEQCRQSLGGHGYSAYSGLPSLLADFAVNCTWEGDNTVLAQQTARYLVKCWKKATNKKELHGFESYIGIRLNETLNFKVFTGDLMNIDHQIQVLQMLACKLIDVAARRLNAERETRKNKTDAWNECMVDLIYCARVHCDAFTLHCFNEASKAVKDNNVRTVLRKLCALQGFVTLHNHFGYLIEERFLTTIHARFIREQIRLLCRVIRNEAVVLVDSFNIPDFVIGSPLGRYDGQIYHHYLETVKKAPNAIRKPHYWEELIKPLTSTNQ